MGKGSVKSSENMYFHCRKDAAEHTPKLYSREGAAELLGVSVSTLADYELGNTKVVPVDKVVLMADLYRHPELKTWYCKHECPVGCDYPIATQVTGLEGAALRLVNAIQEDKVKALANQIMEIASDGVIGADEQDKMSAIINNLDKMIIAITEIKIIARKEMSK